MSNKGSASVLPINKCKRCKNSVQSGLKCITCGVISHKSCLNALKSVKFIDDVTVNCCADSSEDQAVCNQPITQGQKMSYQDTKSSVDDIKIKYLEELLRQKDLTITNQAIAINSLQDQVSYLKRELMISEKPISDKVINEPISKPLSYAQASSRSISSNTSSKNTSKAAVSNITPSAVSHAIHLAKAHEVCQNIVQLNEDRQDGNERVMQHSVNRVRRRSRNILIGDSNDLSTNSILKSAKDVSFKHFHSTNWDPETSDEALLNYLKGIVSEVKIEKLNSRNPSIYASFKISVPSVDVDKIMKAEVWPSGVVLNQFFRSFKPASLQSTNRNSER